MPQDATALETQETGIGGQVLAAARIYIGTHSELKRTCICTIYMVLVLK